MSPLTVCLLNYRRPENLHRIVDALRRQTIRPTIFLWNNSGQPFQREGIDWQVDSGVNSGCRQRWFMATQAETEFVASLDDDLIPADDRLLTDALEIAAELSDDLAVGPFGAILYPGRSYSAHEPVQGVSTPTPVDLVKGRCLIVRAAALRRVFPTLYQSPNGLDEDDIAVCGALASGEPGRHLVHPVFAGRLVELPAGQVGREHRPDHYARREAARRVWLPGTLAVAHAKPAATHSPPRGTEVNSGHATIRVGTCVTENYLPRAGSCLRSLPGCGAVPFVVTYGWHGSEQTRRDFPDLAWHHLPAGQPADCSGCVQYGAWLDALPHGPGDVLVMADADAVFQRALADDELGLLESLRDNQVAVGPNADPKDTLLREAARLRGNGREPSDATLDRLYPGFAKVHCYNCGFIAARASWWHRLRAAFVEAWPAFDRVFTHRSRCQWLTCWLIHAMGAEVKMLPYSMHAHQHMGVPRGCRIDGRPPVVLCGDRPVFFAHHFPEVLRWREKRSA